MDTAQLLIIVFGVIVTLVIIGTFFLPDKSGKDDLSLRALLMSQAPPVPEWFEPKMPPAPIDPGYISNRFGKNSHHPMKEVFMNHYDSEGDEDWVTRTRTGPMEWDERPATLEEVPQSLRDEVAEFIKKRNKYDKDINNWREEKNIQTIIQWQAYYAEARMKEQEEYEAEQLD